MLEGNTISDIRSLNILIFPLKRLFLWNQKVLKREWTKYERYYLLYIRWMRILETKSYFRASSDKDVFWITCGFVHPTLKRWISHRMSFISMDAYPLNSRHSSIYTGYESKRMMSEIFVWYDYHFPSKSCRLQ